jgi:hypothetical protein
LVIPGPPAAQLWSGADDDPPESVSGASIAASATADSAAESFAWPASAGAVETSTAESCVLGPMPPESTGTLVSGPFASTRGVPSGFPLSKGVEESPGPPVAELLELEQPAKAPMARAPYTSRARIVLM